MVTEFHDPDAGFNVPQHTGHVTGRSDNLSVIDEPAAREIARVSTEFPGALDRANPAFLRTEIVNGANVVETTAGDKVARRRIGTGHDPRRAKGDGMDLVRCVGIPDDELAVLRSRDQVALVGSPVHCVNLSQMTLERSPRLHHDPGQRLHLTGHSSHWTTTGKRVNKPKHKKWEG